MYEKGLRKKGIWECADVEMALFSFASKVIGASRQTQILLQLSNQLHILQILPTLLRLLRRLVHLSRRLFDERHRARRTVEGVISIQGLAPRALPGLERGIHPVGRVIDEPGVLQQLPLDIRAGQVNIHLRHRAVLLPAGDEPELHLREPLLLAVAPGQIGEPGVADGVRVNRFRHPEFPGNVLQLVLNRPDTHAPGRVPIPPGGHKERGVCVRTERVRVDPGLQIRHGADQPEAPHPGLAVHDHHRTVAVELDVADVEAQEFPDPGARVPHEHDQRAVTRLVADIDEPDDVLAGDQLVDGEMLARTPHPDVTEEFLLPVGDKPAEEELQFEDVALQGEGADGRSSFDEVVFQPLRACLLCVAELAPGEEGVDPPDLRIDGLLLQLLELEVANVLFEIRFIDRIEVLQFLYHIHWQPFSRRG